MSKIVILIAHKPVVSWCRPMSAFIAFRVAAAPIFRPAALPRLTRLPAQCIRQPPLWHRALRIEGKRHIKDNQIYKLYRVVQLVNSETGRLGEPTPLKEILDSIDRNTEFVELVSGGPAPVVKILNKHEVYLYKKEQKSREKEGRKANAQKEVQFTWGAAESDLAHKLERVRVELAKGSKVDIVFTARKGQKSPPRWEMQRRLTEIAEMFSDISKEWRGKEYSRIIAAVYLQGIRQTQSEDATEEVKPVDLKKQTPRIRKQEPRSQPLSLDEVQDLWKT